MRAKPFVSIYNMKAVATDGNTLFGRYCDTLKQVKKEVMNHKWILRINHIVFKSKIYSLKEIINYEEK